MPLREKRREFTARLPERIIELCFWDLPLQKLEIICSASGALVHCNLGTTLICYYYVLQTAQEW